MSHLSKRIAAASLGLVFFAGTAVTTELVPINRTLDGEAFMEQLDGLGFDVIPVDFIDVSMFGGALHCSTVDVEREGDMKDYFPNQIPGF